MSIPLSNMKTIRVCVNLCHKHPDMIDMELPPCQDTFPSCDKYSTSAYTSGVTDKLA